MVIRLVVRGYFDGVYFCPSPMPKEKPLLTIKVTGPAVKPGRIPVPLLLKICGEAQTAVNRQAEVLEGNKSIRPGPHLKVVSRECTLELMSLKKGSTRLNFASLSDQGALSESIRMEAISAVPEALKSVSRKRGPLPNIGVLDSLNNLGDVFDKGVTKLQFIIPAHNGNKRISVDYDRKLRPRIQARLQPALPLDVPSLVVDGTSLEGTLELTEGKGRIVPAVGSPLAFNFGSDKAETVLGATRKPVKVKVDPRTHKLKEIEITSPHEVFGGDFFTAKTVDQLIAEQGIHPITHLEALSGAIPDEDVDEMVADIYRERQR
jgi:hypothetical protein